jgi:hypothetical protein
LKDGFDAGSPRIEQSLEGNGVAVDFDRSRVRNERARKYFDERRFTGTVVADDTENFARVQFEIDAAQCRDGAEGFGNPRRA